MLACKNTLHTVSYSYNWFCFSGLDKMFVNLFDNDQGESLNVAEQMVESGHAEYELKTQKPVEQKSL